MNPEEYIDLIELMELLNIPAIERHLYSAIENCKTREYFNQLERFREKKKILREVLYASFSRENEKEQKEFDNILYWFEMMRYRKGYWKLKALEPSPPPYFEKSEIIPEDITQIIESFPVNPDKVERLLDVGSHFYGKTYDLRFTIFSPYMVCGTISENQHSKVQRFKSRVFSWNEQLDEAYKVLFYYMEKFPQLRNCLLNKFFDILKFVFDENRNGDM